MSLLEKMSMDLPFSIDELIRLTSTARYRYKVYKIPKRQPNKFRTIAQPSAEIKVIQRWLIKHVLSSLPVHRAATAYRIGGSIADHASLHAGKRFILKMDFSDFFPSILADDVTSHLVRFGKHTTEDAQLITRTVIWDNKINQRPCLSIGAPSSPILSNTILYEFDKFIVQALRGRRIAYSRYADDMAFSTDRPNALNGVVSQVQEILDKIPYPRLSINQTKTIFTSRGCRQTLVGLILTPTGEVSLGRDRKRRIRSELNRFSKGMLTETEKAHLMGELAFAWSMEQSYILSLVRQFGTIPFRKLSLPFGVDP